MTHQSLTFLIPQSLHDIGHWLHLAFRDLLVSESQDLQKRQRLLGLLVTGYVLENGFCLTVLRDDERLALRIQLIEDVRRVRLCWASRLLIGAVIKDKRADPRQRRRAGRALQDRTPFKTSSTIIYGLGWPNDVPPT